MFLGGVDVGLKITGGDFIRLVKNILS